MPIYEYRCGNGHLSEVFQSMSDDPISECPECGAAVEKVLSAPAIHYKGSGFYTTDYGSKKRPVESGSGSDSKSSDSSSGSSDSGSSGSSGSSDSGSSSKPDSGSSSNGSSGSSETKKSGSSKD